MDATPINFDSAIPLGAVPSLVDAEFSDAAARKWVALHDAAAVVATLAGLPRAVPSAALCGFAAAIADAPHWRRRLAAQGVEDLGAIMEPGLAALIAVHTAQGDAAVPARALWHEFTQARDALLALVSAPD